MNSKPFYMSKTLWGAVMLFAMFLYAVFTGESPPVQDISIEGVEGAVNPETGAIDAGVIGKALMGFIMFMLTALGRITANTQLRTK